jgi:hypothetical protein
MSTLRNFSAVHWSALALACALLSHLLALPWPALGALALALATRRLPLATRQPWCDSAADHRGLVAVPAWGWSDSATLRTVLLTVLALKWAESRSDAEFSAVGSAAAGQPWGCAVGRRRGAGLGGRGLLLLLGAQVPTLTSLPDWVPRWHGTWCRPCRWPQCCLCFSAHPGMLWDIGLSFGLPLP